MTKRPTPADHRKVLTEMLREPLATRSLRDLCACTEGLFQAVTDALEEARPLSDQHAYALAKRCRVNPAPILMTVWYPEVAT